MVEGDSPDERATLVHNEQTKLRATLFNTVAAGFVIAGIITPIATYLRDAAATPAGSLLPAAGQSGEPDCPGFLLGLSRRRPPPRA